jgi:hypothetical protein
MLLVAPLDQKTNILILRSRIEPALSESAQPASRTG